MPRDYAQKPQPRRQRRQPSKVPRWVWVLTVLIAIGFIGTLYMLSQQPAQSPVNRASGQSDVLSDVQALLDSRGQGEQDKNAATAGSESGDSDGNTLSRRAQLEFYTLLEQTDVFVPDDLVALRQRDEPDNAEPDSTEEGSERNDGNESEPGGQFVIQVASFRSATDADNLRARLILEGLTTAHITQVDLGEQGTFHRVMIGPVQSGSDTDRISDRLDTLGLQGLVRNYGGD